MMSVVCFMENKIKFLAALFSGRKTFNVDWVWAYWILDYEKREKKKQNKTSIEFV